MTAVDKYLENTTPTQKAEFERIRKIVQGLVPDAEEVISYGMPTFKQKGKPLLYFGAFKHHMSIFPTSGPVEALKDKLSGYTVSKGTIQFTEDKPLSEEIITELILLRLSSITKA